MSTQNLSGLYRPSELIFHPEFSTYHLSDSVSRLFIRFNPDELLFIRQADDHYRGKLQVHVQLIKSYENTEVKDTGSAFFAFEMESRNRVEILSFDFRVHSTGDALLHVFLSDVNKNYREDFFTNFDNSNTNVRQCFLVRSQDSEVYFRNYYSDADTLFISYRDSSVKNLICKCYYRAFPLAIPPYSYDTRENFNYKPDSVFLYDLRDQKGLVLPKDGFYHFQSDTSIRDGLTLYRFPSGFPGIKTPGQMLESMRYLTTRKEFEEMNSNPNRKSAVDAFWLDKGRSSEKTRILIKKYYSRIQEANKYFTSFTEGWRTDRGMMYTIFGSPTSIFRGHVTESWTYGSPNSSLSLSLFFIKVKNPFSDNDYILQRSPVYESNWFRAVDVWRQGRAYNSMY